MCLTLTEFHADQIAIHALASSSGEGPHRSNLLGSGLTNLLALFPSLHGDDDLVSTVSIINILLHGGIFSSLLRTLGLRRPTLFRSRRTLGPRGSFLRTAGSLLGRSDLVDAAGGKSGGELLGTDLPEAPADGIISRWLGRGESMYIRIRTSWRRWRPCSLARWRRRRSQTAGCQSA